MQVFKLIILSLLSTSCATSLESTREMGRRSGEGYTFTGINKLQVTEDTGKVKRLGPKVLRVWVHPVLGEGTYAEGHYMQIEVDNGHWQKTAN